MATRDNQSIQPADDQASISACLNAVRVLPTESAADYRLDLERLIQELDAHTPLQVYLVENIHECLLWLRRYRLQKQHVILKTMAHALQNRSSQPSYLNLRQDSKAEDDLFGLLHGSPDAPQLKDLLDKAATTLTALQADALSLKRDELVLLDERIVTQTKLLQGLMAEYERLANRNLKQEYLRLQVENLRRDLNALEADQS